MGFIQNILCKRQNAEIAIWKNSVNSMQISIADLNKRLLERDKHILDLQKQLKDLKNQPILTEAKVLGTIANDTISAILKKEISTLYSIELSDNNFSITSVEEAKKFTEQTRVSLGKYVAEDHDCENFSFALLGYWSDELKSFAFGYARSANHAFNVMVDVNNQIWVCEPQQNLWWKYEDVKDNPMYQITEVLM